MNLEQFFRENKFFFYSEKRNITINVIIKKLAALEKMRFNLSKTAKHVAVD